MCEDGEVDREAPVNEPLATEIQAPSESGLETRDFTEFISRFFQSKNPKTATTYLHCLRACSRFLRVSGTEEAVSTRVLGS